MRPWQAGGVALVLGCGTPPTDAERYRAALVSAPTFEAAQDACAAIVDPATRGDCQVTITERFERLDPSDCDHVTGPVWLDECRFLLAERLGGAGRLDQAIEMCAQSRFRRYCAWHLVQDAVDATLDLPAAEAEAVLLGFENIPALPDASLQFWRIRWREWAGHGRTADETTCRGLDSQRGCEEALARHVRQLLDAVAKTDLAGTCARPRGERVENRGAAGWVMGPLTTAVESEWEVQRCPRGEAGR